MAEAGAGAGAKIRDIGGAGLKINNFGSATPFQCMHEAVEQN